MPTFATPDPIVATFDFGAGHLRIRATDRADTVVEVRPTDDADEHDVRAAEQAEVQLTDGRLLVRGSKRKLRSLFGRPASIDVTVDLPTGSRVVADVWADVHGEGRLGDATVETAVGAVRLAETGRLKLRTAVGDVSVGRAGGPAEVVTSSGNIWVGEIDGAATVKSANGGIALGEVTGDVRLNTANGDIAVERALGSVHATTAFGSIRIGEVVRGSVSVETGFGQLDLGVREGTAAWLDVATSGRVRSELEASAAPSPSDDTVEVRGRTGYGDIVIRRAEPAR